MVVDRKGKDLEVRMLDFAARVRKVIDAIPETRLGQHIAGQLVRSGTSPAPRLHFAFVNSHFNFFNSSSSTSTKTQSNRFCAARDRGLMASIG